MSRTVRIDPGARRDPVQLGTGIIGERGLRAPHAGGRCGFVATGEATGPA